MVKIIIQATSHVEFDTETGRQRLLKGWTKVLGKGNGAKKKTVKTGAPINEATEEDAWN